MRRLGRLLLKSWKKKRSQSRKIQATFLVRQRQKRNLSFFKVLRSEKKPVKETKISKQNQPPTLETSIILQPEVPPQPPPPASHLVEKNFLSSHELIRPEEKLRSSIEAFLLDQRSPHTQRAYGKDLKRFVRFLLERKWERGVEQIDRSLVVAYKESLLSEKLEHTTVDRHLSTLRSFFRWLMDDGLIEKNPATSVRFLKPRRLSTTNGFTDDEVTKMLTLPNLHTRIGALHYAVLLVLFYCGLRRSELCALRTKSIGEERGHPILRLKGKGNAERIIVLIKPVWNALRYYFRITQRDFAKDEYLFMPVRNNRTGQLEKPLDSSSVYYIVTQYARKAGISKRVSPHSCRATAISNARDHNVPDRAIQEFAGWATPDMITRYDKRKNAVEKSAAHSISYGIESKDHLPSSWTPFSTDDSSPPPAPDSPLAPEESPSVADPLSPSAD